MTHTLAILFLAGGTALAADPQRPPITGIANFAAKVSDLDAARNFYGHVLGYQEAFSLPQAGGAPDLLCFKVNDRQYLEVSPELKDAKADRLIHIGFETADARKLRGYLASKGVDVPAAVSKDKAGNLSFVVKDPDGHGVEFVEYLPGSIHSRNIGKLVAGTRVSDHILHVGIHVTDRARTDHFYRDILGFRLMWEGGPVTNPSAWISYLVPDGSDWVEYMMLTATPNPRQLGGMHHAALAVMDIQKPYQTVVERGYTPPGKPVLARDGRWLANFYDPDGTRTEMMIRKPVQTPCCTPLHDPYIEPAPAANAAAGARPVLGPWVDPVTDEPAGTHYKTFHSKTIDADVSYLVWLPPEYETARTRRYPVIYWLHGGGGSQRNGAFFVETYASAIERGAAPAAIIVLPNGLRESNWVDAKDGKTPVETVIVKDLIPHIDETYRTIAKRQGRAIEGSSMGGWGAIRLGFRHNELFGAVSGLQPAVVSEKDQPMKLPRRVFDTVYSGDSEYFRINTAWTVAEQYAHVVRKHTLVRVAVGDQDDWTYEHSKPYDELLTRLEIPHEFIVAPGIKHDPAGVYRVMGDKAFAFFAKAFSK